ncbi:MAG: pantetheine-phosphate adenylyltransferase [Bacteroidota bacterium]
MPRIALFPGSFDPVTVGHVDIVKRSAPLFEKIVIGVGINSTKQTMFSLEQRIKWLQETFADLPKVEVHSYEGLTVDFCKKCNAQYILRGLRTSTDFQFEKAIAQMNQLLQNEIETVFILSSPQYSPVSSTIVRDIIRHGGDVKQFLPSTVIPKL